MKKQKNQKNQRHERNLNLHNAPLAVVANVVVRDVKTGKPVRTYSQCIGRAFNQKDAENEIFHAKNVFTEKHVGFNGTELIFKKCIESAPRITYINNEGKHYEEVVSSYEIMPVSEYIRMERK